VAPEGAVEPHGRDELDPVDHVAVVQEQEQS
jgi:hypothetical protein